MYFGNLKNKCEFLYLPGTFFELDDSWPELSGLKLQNNSKIFLQ